MLGVAWHALSFLITVGVLGFLYSTVFNRDPDQYVPYLAAGFLVWRYIASVVVEGARSVIDGRGFLTQLAIPISIYPLKLVCTHVYLMGFNAIAFGAILAIARIWVAPNPALLILGLTIVSIAGVATALLLGVASVFQRWLLNLIPAVMSLAFFVTPILWMPNMLLGGESHPTALDPNAGLEVRSALVLVNPFYYFLEIVRGPLLGNVVPLAYWLVATAITAALLIAALLLLSFTKPRLLLNL